MFYLNISTRLQAGMQVSGILFLILGYLLIRQRALTGHALCMSMATLTSLVFLSSFIAVLSGGGYQNIRVHGPAEILFYLNWAVYIPAVICLVPLALMSLWRALCGKMLAHIQIARPTLILWLYVHCSGLFIYWQQGNFFIHETA